MIAIHATRVTLMIPPPPVSSPVLLLPCQLSFYGQVFGFEPDVEVGLVLES